METIRILHILHSMNRGGAENALMNFYRHIDRSKVQFDFLLTDHNRTQFEDEIEELGGKIYRIPRLNILSIASYINGIKQFLQQHPEYRIIHSHTSSKSFFPLWVGKRLNIPIRIAHSHAARNAKGIKGIGQTILKPFLYCVATHKVACGIDAAIWLYGKKSYEKGKCLIFKNVIETGKFSFNSRVRDYIRKKYNIDNNTVVIGCIGRLCYQKNQQFALKILSELHNMKYKACLFLIGIGEDEEMLRNLSDKLNVNNQVIFTGVVSNSQDFYQAFDLFLLPSLYEGLPLVLTEAQVSGLRCIASDTIDRGADLTGLVDFLSLKETPGFWANHIKGLIPYERKDRIADLIRNGFDAKTTAHDLQQFYIDCLKKS